jgi:hypothetical protein
MLPCVYAQVRMVWVDNPESVHKQIKEYFGEHLGSGVFLRGGDPDDGIKLDIGHVLFSRLGRTLPTGHPMYCEHLCFNPGCSCWSDVCVCA